MSISSNRKLEETSFLSRSNSAFIEEMYLKYLKKDTDLPKEWKIYFEKLNEEASIAVKEFEGPSWGKKSKFKSEQLENIVLENKDNNLSKNQNYNKINQFTETPKLPLPYIKNLRKWINNDKKAS